MSEAGEIIDIAFPGSSRWLMVGEAGPELICYPSRRRLPNRREQLTETVAVPRGDGGLVLVDISVGFDPETGRPKEVFLAGAREGSDTGFEWADIATALSVALQSGVTATAMARSAAAIPDGTGGLRRASVTAAALDLIARYEAEDWA